MTEDRSTILDLFSPILNIKQVGRQADQKPTHHHSEFGQHVTILSLRPAHRSQRELLGALAKERKVIVKRDLKLAISPWHVRILIPWQRSSTNIWEHGDP